MLNDASLISLNKAEFGLDMSFENQGRDDLSYELVKRDWITWGVNYNLDFQEKMVHEDVVHPTNSLN